MSVLNSSFLCTRYVLLFIPRFISVQNVTVYFVWTVIHLSMMHCNLAQGATLALVRTRRKFLMEYARDVRMAYLL